MEIITKLFLSHGIVQAMLLLTLVIILGILLGRIKICGVSFGIGGILFSGIILGNFGLSIDTAILSFVREFGLILFVFAVGMQVGPSLTKSLRSQGAVLNLMAVFIVLSGAAVAVLCYVVFDLTIPQAAGILCGAVTNTPALGSATEAYSQLASTVQAASNGINVIGTGYAVAYPCGIIGLIVIMIVLKKCFFNEPAQTMTGVSREEARQMSSVNQGGAGSQPAAYTHDFLVSSTAILGKSLEKLSLPEGISITQIVRTGVQRQSVPSEKLRLGDTVTVSCQDSSMLQSAENFFGNSRQALDRPFIMPIMLGIFIGIFVGSLPVTIPGLPMGIKLGVAGGTLVIAILLSNIHHLAGMTWYMTSSTCLFLRELGIMLFLACVGIYSSTGFVSAIAEGQGLQWMGIGGLITVLPVLSTCLICHFVWKLDYATICGLISGSMTDPPALAFSMQHASSDRPAEAYASVYPLTMILRILMGQLMIIGLSAFA